MPPLHPKANLDDTVKSSATLLVRNSFLISRLVILVLLTNFAFLSLIFASWNINATLSFKDTAPGTSIFIIFESCLVFCFALYTIAGFFLPKLRWSKTFLECCFVGVLSAFHISSAVSASIQSFASACRLASDWNVCASASLLMPLTWLNSVISLGYFLTLFMTIMAHRSIYPDIWTRSLYEVEWFGQPPMPLRKEQVVRDFLQKGNNQSVVPPYCLYDDVEYEPSRKEVFRPNDVEDPAPWLSPGIRRGVDVPFVTKRSHLGGSLTTVATSPPTLPLCLPNRSATPNSTWTSGSRFIERFRESMVLARPETTSQFSSHYHARKDSNSFPRSVDDVDQPIPLPRLSKWISADGRQVNEAGGRGKSRRWI